MTLITATPIIIPRWCLHSNMQRRAMTGSTTALSRPPCSTSRTSRCRNRAHRCTHLLRKDVPLLSLPPRSLFPSVGENFRQFRTFQFFNAPSLCPSRSSVNTTRDRLFVTRGERSPRGEKGAGRFGSRGLHGLPARSARRNSTVRCVTVRGIRAINQMPGNERNAVRPVAGSSRWPV